MRSAFHYFVLAGLVLGGCARDGSESLRPAGRKAKQEVEPLPGWTTRRGKVEARLDIAGTFIEMEKYTEALMMLTQLRAEGVRQPRLDFLQGQALYRTGLAEQGEELLLSAARRMRQEASPYRELGLLYADELEVEKALEAFEAAIDRDENHAETWNNYGYLLMCSKRYDEATEALNQAVLLDGSKLLFRNNLGYALALSGKSDQALRLFRSTHPEATAQVRVANAMEMAGEDERALVHYSKALEADPTDREAIEGSRRLNLSMEQDP